MIEGQIDATKPLELSGDSHHAASVYNLDFYGKMEIRPFNTVVWYQTHVSSRLISRVCTFRCVFLTKLANVYWCFFFFTLNHILRSFYSTLAIHRWLATADYVGWMDAIDTICNSPAIHRDLWIASFGNLVSAKVGSKSPSLFALVICPPFTMPRSCQRMNLSFSKPVRICTPSQLTLASCCGHFLRALYRTITIVSAFLCACFVFFCVFFFEHRWCGA